MEVHFPGDPTEKGGSFVLEIRSGVTTFASTRPSVEEVTAFLAGCGFTLTWSMKAREYKAGLSQPFTDPAHYHYQDQENMEIVYVDGPGRSLSEVPFPPHVSRWWVYPGHHPSHAFSMQDALSARWKLTWLPDQE